MHFFPRLLRFWTALLLLLYWSAFHISPAAAGLVPSQTSGSTAISSARDADQMIVQRALENRVVAQKLADYGVRATDVQLRLASMSAQDVHTLAAASKGLPSGGEDAIGFLIGILIIVLLVVVILKLMDKKIIVR
jgi:hypothetical protein